MLMEIKKASFLVSNSQTGKCPFPDKPEYAFTGRSNVGKSSLINMLVNRKTLAKTSATPGKTQLINHFIINDSWYLVDLPGYGYARAPQKEIRKWSSLVERYLLERSNLCALFVLVDIRHPARQSDLSFMEWLGEKQIPFVVVFTKSDKLTPGEAAAAVDRYRTVLSEGWEPLPPLFVTSSLTGSGREAILGFIGGVNKEWEQPPVKRGKR